MTNYKVKRTLMGQLSYGDDLYEGLTQIAYRENIRCGRIHGLGATTFARVAFYDQNTNRYNPLEFTGGMEILGLFGNFSVRNGKPFVHAHIVLGDAEGKVFGGHLLPGTKLFACELFIEEYEGEPLVREFDERTGLHLWKGGKLVQ